MKNKVTNKAVIKSVAQELGLSEDTVRDVMYAIFRTIADSLIGGWGFTIKGFGTFRSIKRNRYFNKGTIKGPDEVNEHGHYKTGKWIKSRNIVTFSTSPKLRENVARGGKTLMEILTKGDGK